MHPDMKARVVLEALRAGVVNKHVVRHLTYGRDQETATIEAHVRAHPAGSSQVVVGGYGVGKSHLMEVVALRLEMEGYAVARLEMGASHGRAENPRSVVQTIEQGLRVQVDGRIFNGAAEFASLIRAIRTPRRHYLKEKPRLDAIHRQLEGREKLLERYDAIREAIPQIWGTTGHEYVPDLSLARLVPTAMTAANHAVSKLNGLSHDLNQVGVPGLVVIFDEAERAEFAGSYYRADRARELMKGFALASANLDTTHLKHHMNLSRPMYCPDTPSLLHSVFAFTWPWGLANEIAVETECPVLQLAVLPVAVRSVIAHQVLKLYRSTYGNGFSLTAADGAQVSSYAVNEDIRSFIRCLVSALDYRRLEKEFPLAS